MLIYKKGPGDRTIPELKVGDEFRVVKEDGNAMILEVTARQTPYAGKYKFGVTNKTPGVSLDASNELELFNVNFLFY